MSGAFAFCIEIRCGQPFETSLVLCFLRQEPLELLRSITNDKDSSCSAPLHTRLQTGFGSFQRSS